MSINVEIDAVIGIDRLPEYRDRPSLPYVEAVMRELSRWHPVVPLSEFSEVSIILCTF